MTFESSSLLREIWNDVNETCFGSALKPPSSIGWVDLSGEPDLEEPFGSYSGRHNFITISKQFQYLESKEKELRAAIEQHPPGSAERLEAKEKMKTIFEIVFRLVAHETVHQAEFQFSGATGHGEDFVEQAKKVAKALEIPPPTTRDAPRWPEVALLIQRERGQTASS